MLIYFMIIGSDQVDDDYLKMVGVGANRITVHVFKFQCTLFTLSKEARDKPCSSKQTDKNEI